MLNTQIPGGERVARFVYLVIFLSAHEAAVCGIGKSYQQSTLMSWDKEAPTHRRLLVEAVRREETAKGECRGKKQNKTKEMIKQE